MRTVTLSCLIVLPALAQVPPAPTPPPRRVDQQATNMDRGEGQEVDLYTLVRDLELEGKVVRTRGRLVLRSPDDPRAPEYHVLTDGKNVVFALPGYGLFVNDIRQLEASRSEVLVTGVVRAIQRDRSLTDSKQYPDLPQLPEPAPGMPLPRVSITILRISRSVEGPEEETLGQARRILAEPERYSGKVVRIVGEFRGRNLFDDLPEASRRGGSDWVLKDGKVALWIRGKPPEGKGFSLDPLQRSDVVRWLAVEGKAEVADGVVYVKATQVLLTSPPRGVSQ